MKQPEDKATQDLFEDQRERADRTAARLGKLFHRQIDDAERLAAIKAEWIRLREVDIYGISYLEHAEDAAELNRLILGDG